MKKLLLGLLLLPLLAPVPAEAARRDERAAASPARVKAVKPVPQAARPATRPAAAPTRQAARPTRQAARQAATLRRVGIVSSAQAAAPRAACTRRGGRLVCERAERSSGIAGWQNGLSPADYSQRDCPSGTFATLARGHEDVVRCMPI